MIYDIAGGEIEGNAANSTASGPERTRAWVVEQLAGVCSLEATSESSMHLAVHYLALQAFFEVDGSAVSAISPARSVHPKVLDVFGLSWQLNVSLSQPCRQHVRRRLRGLQNTVFRTLLEAHDGRPSGDQVMIVSIGSYNL